MTNKYNGAEQSSDTTRMSNNIENARQQSTPSDTDKMEKTLEKIHCAKCGGYSLCPGVMSHHHQPEIEELLKNERQRTIEEVMEKIRALKATCDAPMSHEDYIARKVLDTLLDSLNTNMKE